jgi:hypothetical protein
LASLGNAVTPGSARSASSSRARSARSAPPARERVGVLERELGVASA